MAEEIKLSKRERRVFDYITQFGSITSMQAFVDLGETQLPGAIFELRGKGVHISSKDLKVKNRFGEQRIVKQYFLG